MIWSQLSVHQGNHSRRNAYSTGQNERHKRNQKTSPSAYEKIAGWKKIICNFQEEKLEVSNLIYGTLQMQQKMGAVSNPHAFHY